MKTPEEECPRGSHLLRRCLRVFLVMLCPCFSPAVCVAQVPQAVVGTTETGIIEQTPQHDASFEFHSSFWLNLHLRLYEEARQVTGHPLSFGGGASAQMPALRTVASDPAEKKLWKDAIQYYAAHFAQNDLLFDARLAAITDRLASMENCSAIFATGEMPCTSGLDPGLVAVLESVAPIYRTREWPIQDRENRIWVAGKAPLVRDLSGKLSKKLSSIYQSSWPSQPIRVDIAGYAGPYGGYTTTDPPRITISSEDPRNQGISGIEVLFHEASHLLAKNVQLRIASECESLKKPIPRDLWHALLFYTTGVVVEQALSDSPASGAAHSYVPYAEKYGLYARGWEAYEKALQAYWLPYLEGKTSFDRAIESLAANS